MRVSLESAFNTISELKPQNSDSFIERIKKRYPHEMERSPSFQSLPIYLQGDDEYSTWIFSRKTIV